MKPDPKDLPSVTTAGTGRTTDLIPLPGRRAHFLKNNPMQSRIPAPTQAQAVRLHRRLDSRTLQPAFTRP
jgi:hypothetical protein